MKRQASHVVDTQLGGGKRVRLTVIDSNAPSFIVERHVGTWKRSECPTVRPCPRVFCVAHLWRIDACERAGRPSLAKVPRNAAGHTISISGVVGEGVREGTLDPGWLQEPPRASCAWDLIEQAAGEPMSNEEIAEHLGRHRTLVARVWKRALHKLVAAGVTIDAWRALVDPEVRNGNLAEVIETGVAR